MYRNKWLCLVVCGILSLISNSKEAAAWSYGEFISCNAINANPKVVFKTSYGKLIHDLSRSKEEITAMDTGNKNSENHEGVWGRATMRIEMATHFKKMRLHYLDDNASCVIPEEIEVYIGIKEPTIYVANDFPYDSCEFSFILRHEQTHQRINKLTFDYMLPLMEKTARRIVKDVRAVKVKNREEAQEGIDLMHRYYYLRLMPIVEEFWTIRNQEQLKLDNQASYDMQHEYCSAFNKKKKVEK